ncbi:MAG: LysR family transcriptional regulator [Xylophilus ampelinus]
MTSIRTLRTFLAVAAEGSFTAAGERVALTQAAVGLQMRALEADLKRPLFRRTGKSVELNEQGRELLPLARQMVALHEQMRHNPAASAPMEGTAHLGGVVSVLRRLVQATLRLKARHPALDLHVSTAKSHVLVGQVVAGELDAAIVVRDFAPFHAGLAWTPLFREPMVLLAPAGPPPPSARALLESRPFIRFDRSEHTGQLVERALQRLRARPQEFLELNAIEAIVDLVRSGLGVTVLPLLHGAGWDADPRLRVQRLPAPAGSRQIALAHAKSTPRAALIAAVRREFEAPDARAPASGPAPRGDGHGGP